MRGRHFSPLWVRAATPETVAKGALGVVLYECAAST